MPRSTHHLVVGTCFWKWLLFLTPLLFFLFTSIDSYSAHGTKKVLVIHSYHKGLSWTDSLAKGINDTLEGSGKLLDISHDFMDTKRIYSSGYLNQLVDIYYEKYKSAEIDVIITTDDHAFQFLLKHQPKLFPKTPVVFCGVNNFKAAMLESTEWFTGVVERFDIASTLKLVKKIHPGAKRYFAISDQSLTGKTNSKLFNQNVEALALDVEVILLDHHSMQEVREQVATLGNTDVAFWLTFTSDRLGQYFSFRQSASNISEVSKVPLYSFWDFHLGFGTMGGMLTSGYFQGKKAAELAEEILGGTRVKNIPVISESPNRYMFDHKQLARFDINQSLLPHDSVIINKPVTFYSQYRTLVLSLLTGFVALGLIIFLLLLNIIYRRRANLEIQRGKDRFQHIFNDAAVALFELDFSEAYRIFLEICKDCESKEFEDVVEILRSDCTTLLSKVRLVDCNHAAAILYDATSKDEIFDAGVGGLKLISTDTFINILHTMVRGNERVEWEGKGVTLAGSELHLLKNIQQFETSPLFADYSSVIISVVDITDREKYITELRISEDRFRTVFDNAASGIALCDADGNYLRINSAFSSMLGYTTDELLQKNWRDITHPESFAVTDLALKRIFSGMENQPIEKQYLHKDGHNVWALINIGLQQSEPDTPKCYIAQTQDITQIKEVQAKMRIREQKYKQLFEADLSGFYIASPAGNLLLCNQVFADILGFENDEELLGKNIVPLYSQPDTWPVLVGDLKDGKRVENLEVELLRRDGKIINAICNAIGRRDENGQLLEIQGHIADISKQKKLEGKLLRAQKMEAIGLMAGGVAHDLNNILSGIVSYPDLMLGKIEENSPLRKPLYLMKESGKRAAAVVADLLTVARGAANVRELHSLRVLVTEYLNSPEGTNLSTLHPTIKIDLEHDADNGTILCSPVHIKKCIMNLVTNAAEAIEGAGKIKIRVSEQTSLGDVDSGMVAHDYVNLSVTDNGTGISDKDLDHIFEPFYTKKVMGRSGTGLGLAVVWNTVQDHGGAIQVDSGGGGTTFTLSFPRYEKIERKAEAAFDPVSIQGKGQRILIVDDEPMLRDIAKQILLSLGYKVEVAESGEDALYFLSSNRVELVLLDMFMDPGLNGCQTYEHIQRIYPEQKALIASGYSKSDDVKKALRLGVGGFIEKPYSLAQLGRAVAKILQP